MTAKEFIEQYDRRPICFNDTETCGFHGPIVLIQYAIEPDYEIKLHNVWLEPVWKTLQVIWEIMECKIVCYNLAFDWFHYNKLYNMLRLVEDKNIYPIDHITLMVELEAQGRDGKCLKPHSCLDLMLHARKGPYQSTMGIKPIIVRKVPNACAIDLRETLEQEFDIDPIYMAGYKRRTENWTIVPSDRPGFSDIKLVFKPSTGLKAMSEFVLNRKRDSYTDVNPPVSPVELGYAPYAKAIIELRKWPTATAPPLFGTMHNGAWPLVIEQHINHWAYIPAAQEYARLDVQDTMDLYFAFGEPEFDDNDSVLAAMVGATRYKGFAYDRDKVIATQKKFKKLISSEIPYTNSIACRRYLRAAMTPEQRLTWDGKTEGTQLEAMCEWVGKIAEAAKKVYWSRKWAYLVTLFDKFLVADRFHASFKVIGAKSTRMSGSDGINAQGIPKIDDIRECFNFAFEGEQLSGGDFKAFEVVIFLATCGEGKLLETVTTGGKKIHAVYGEHIYPDMTYDEIMASDGTEDDKYTRSKSGFFLNMYGGTEYALNKNIGIPMEQAKVGIASFATAFPEVGKSQRETAKDYQALKTVDRMITWTDPMNYVESLLGFKRFFNLEIEFMKGLYELAESPPEHWSNEIVHRRDEYPQTASGATRSALFGAAFSLQNSMIRIAGNHKIQSTGAEILKEAQCQVWTLQPAGIQDWKVRTANIHDELLAVSVPELAGKIESIVDDTVSRLREVVPLLDIDWGKGDSWAQVH